MPFESGKLRRGTKFKVSFPTMPSLTYRPAYVELVEKQYHHDVLTIHYLRTSGTWFEDIPTGLPVKFTWNQEGRTREWVGYVSYISKTVQGKAEKPMSVVCVGASYPLKERATRNFSNVTIPDVAAVIAREYGLHLIADTHPTIFPQLTLAGHSYWEWLAEQAKRIGFTLRVDGINLYFQRLDKAIDRKATDSPYLFFEGTYMPPMAQYNDRTLQEFTVLKGEHIESGTSIRAEKKFAGVNPVYASTNDDSRRPDSVGRGLRTEASDVLFREYRSDQVVQSQSMASQLAEGAAHLARLNLPAKIKCMGDPRIVPFAPVRINGTGVKTDGLWVVQQATHNIRSNGEYEIEALIVTDGTGPSKVSSLRPTINKEEGMVNIVAAINSASARGSAWGAEVFTGANAIRPKDEGFNRSNARWRASGVINGSHN